MSEAHGMPDNAFGLPHDVFAALAQQESLQAPSRPTPTPNTCPAACCNQPDPYWASMARYEDDRVIAWAESDHPDAVRMRAVREVQRGFSAAWDAAPTWNNKRGKRRDWDVDAYLAARAAYFAEHWKGE